MTGQFVASDGRKVGRIREEAAQELIKVIQDRLYFSDTAVENILFLSGRIPYFIQMICKNCVFYANEFKTPSITPVELEAVVELMVRREDQVDKNSPVSFISEGAFAANVWSESDSDLTTAVLAILAFHSQAGRKDVFIARDEIESELRRYRANVQERDLVATLEDLSQKEILEDQVTPAGDTEYRISVDLFRRWFIQRQSLGIVLSRLRGGTNYAS